MKPIKTQHMYPTSCLLAIALLLPTVQSSWAQSPSSPAAGSSIAANETVVYQVKRIWTGTGEVIDDAALVVRNGKIVAVGPQDSVGVPAGATVIDRSAETMIPGLVMAETDIGRTPSDELSVTPFLRAVDGLDLFEDQPGLLAAGITTVQINPGVERLIPGRSGVIKLHGSFDQRILMEEESLQIILSSSAFSPPTVYEPPIGANAGIRPLEATRPQLASSLAEAIAGIRALLASSKMELSDETTGIDREILTVLREVAQGKLTARLTAKTAAEISAALQLVEDFKLSAVLVDPNYLSTQTADKLPFKGFVVFPDAAVNRIENVAIPDQDQRQPDSFWDVVKWLRQHERLDDVALGGLPQSDLGDIMLFAAQLRGADLDSKSILQMLTQNPARLMGVDQRVGSLVVGKDADFVLLNQDPFERASRVLATFVNGEAAYQTDENKAAEGKPILVRAGRVYTPEGIVNEGSLVVSGAKIAGVGPDLSRPLDAEVYDFPDGVIIPGMIDLNSEIGFGGPLRDRVELNTKLAAQLISEDKTVAFVRESGITTALVGSSRAPSPLLAFKLTDQPKMLKDPVALRFEVAGNLTNVAETLRRSLNQGKAYADSWKKYNEEFAKYQDELKAYEALVAKQAAEEAKAKAEADAKAAADAKTAGEGKDAAEEKKPAGGDPDRGPESKDGTPGTPAKEVPEKATPAEGDKSKDSSDGDPAKSPGEKTAGAATPATASPDAEAAKTPDKPKEPTKPREVPNLEPYRAVFSGELPIIVVANDANSIELAVELFAKEFKLPTIIAGAREADRALPALKHELVSVAVGPDLIVRRENEKINLPQQLATAGIAFGFQSSAATGASRLPDAIAAATYRGLAVADALESITEAPADFLKLGSIGKLASGYDADLVVLSGSPFDLGTEVLAVMIDGKWVFMKEAK